MNKPALQLIAENKISKNKYLDLGNCGLTELPNELFDCVWLEKLLLSNEWWDFKDKKWISSKNTGEKNKLTSISPLIASLRRLAVIQIGGNYDNQWNISDISFLEKLINLKCLDLRVNHISDFDFLTKLVRLESLYLRTNRIPNSSFLTDLIKLKELCLRLNNVSDYSFLEDMVGLKSLDLSSNRILDYRFLEKMTKLQSLALSSDGISNYSFLSKLINLQSLDLRDNNILDYSFLENLVNLQSLDLRKNKISDINFLAKLSGLKYLNLQKNKISDIVALTKLTGLQFLDLRDNNISDLKPLYALNNLNSLRIDIEAYASLRPIRYLIDDKKIPVKILVKGRSRNKSVRQKTGNINNIAYAILDGNPIFPPLPIVMKGEKEIVAYFNSLKRGQKLLNEVKVLLVGDGASGKTSLVKLLTGKAFNSSEKQTHGIQIQDDSIEVNSEQLKVHYWDFGGQEIMHATHQFFLTKDSVYILVLDGRRDENPEYWLKHIAIFGGNAPVLVVLNKAEDNRAYDIVKQDLDKKYPNIIGYFKISCKTKDGIYEFIQILHNALYDLDFRKTPFSVDWETVKESLRKMEQPHITYPQYYDLCNRCMVQDKSQQDTLLGYLNSLGIILHFEELKQYDTQVLNPLWLTQAVYRIINSPKIADNYGSFDEENLFEILNDTFYQNEALEYDESLVKKILRWFGTNDLKRKQNAIKYEGINTFSFIAKVMQQFELSYNLPKTTSYIIPDLLPIEPPKKIEYKDYPLHFTTEFYFLPPALLPRFIVQVNFNVVDAVKWRTGVVLNAEGVFNAEAVVRVDKEGKALHVFVKGEQKRELLAYIRSVFHGLYESYDGLKQEGRVTELLFLPDRPDISVPYNEIEGLEAIGEEYYSSGKARKKYKLKELFGEIENPDYTLSYAKEKPVKIFISYSRRKKKFREALVTKLYPLIGLKDNYLEVWHDEELEPASDWARDIDEALDNADIVVCLLSDEYLASNYCMYEFKRASKKGIKIYPVLINHCAWRDTPFKEIQGYFTALEPIVASKRPQKWQEVYEKIKYLVEEIKNN